MFNNLKQMAGLAGIMKDLPRIKAKMDDVNAHLADHRVSAESGGGVVKATVTGKLRIVSIQVNPALAQGLLSTDDASGRTMAEGLIVAAVNGALEKAKEYAGRQLADAADELGLPIPPGGLAGLL